MTPRTAPALLVAALTLTACHPDAAGVPPEALAIAPLASVAAEDAPRYSDWSAPVNIGAPVNTTFLEQGSSLSRDGLTLFFHSDRPGGFGRNDIWIAERASVDDPWGPPQNAGPGINTSANETAPTVSVDGHRLYFSSDRAGGLGGSDLYVSHRRDKRDNLGWEAAVNLGPNVNSSASEAVTTFFEDDATGVTTMYFGSTRSGDDIYSSTLQSDGSFSPAVLLADVSTAAAIERQPSVRRDGLELYFASDRSGGQGNLDLWVSTRASTADAWSPAVNLGSVVNTGSIDAKPTLSFDATTLFFQSTRPGGLGPCSTPAGPCVFDLWMTTRTKLKGAE
jgi:WD40-like Beta Propeller Repeat